MTDMREKRRKDPGMEKKIKMAEKTKPQNIEKTDKVWDLISDLNPY